MLWGGWTGSCFLCYNNKPPAIGGGVSATIAGFGAGDAVYFDALRGGMYVVR